MALTPSRRKTSGEILDWSAKGVNDLKKKIIDFASSMDSQNPPRILFIGESGAGKSSFISSIISAFNGYITYSSTIGEITGEETNNSRRFWEHRIHLLEERKTLNFILCDTRGISKSGQLGISDREIHRLLEGRLRHGDLVESDKNPRSGELVEEREAKPPSFVVFVEKANLTGDRDSTVTEKLNIAQEFVRDKSIPSCLVITHIDQVKNKIKLDPKEALKSKTVESLIKTRTKLAGVNENRVFVVKNYTYERRTMVQNDILLLRAFQNILWDVKQYEDNMSLHYMSLYSPDEMKTLPDFMQSTYFAEDLQPIESNNPQTREQPLRYNSPFYEEARSTTVPRTHASARSISVKKQTHLKSQAVSTTENNHSDEDTTSDSSKQSSDYEVLGESSRKTKRTSIISEKESHPRRSSARSSSNASKHLPPNRHMDERPLPSTNETFSKQSSDYEVVKESSRKTKGTSIISEKESHPRRSSARSSSNASKHLPPNRQMDERPLLSTNETFRTSIISEKESHPRRLSSRSSSSESEHLPPNRQMDETPLPSRNETFRPTLRKAQQEQMHRNPTFTFHIPDGHSSDDNS